MDEEWRIISGFERYEVSNQGRVRSNIKDVLVMKLCTHYKGYKIVYIRATVGAADTKCFVHRLVASAFLSNPLNHPIVNHKDLNKGNNMLSNLEWIDESGNMHHWRDARKATDPNDDF